VQYPGITLGHGKYHYPIGHISISHNKISPGYEDLQISTNIWQYLTNDTRMGHCGDGTLI